MVWQRFDSSEKHGSAFAGEYDLIIVGELLKAKAPNVLPFLVRENIEGPGVVIGGPKWTTDDIDSVIKNFVTEEDIEKAKEILAGIDQQLKDEMVCTHLYILPVSATANTGLKGFRTRDERAYPDLTTMYY